MKITIEKTVNYFDVDMAFRLKPGAMFQLLQDAAITHGERVGYGIDHTIRNGDGWVLNKHNLEIYRWPEYREEIRVVTWSRYIRGALGFREFEIFSSDEKVAAASAVYVFVDTHRKKIKRVPKDMSGIYTIEPDVALNPELDKWSGDYTFSPDFTMNISTRFFDFDAMGHVNNTIFTQFLETAVMRMTGASHFQLKELKMQYHKEISTEVKEIQAGLTVSDGLYHFKAFDHENLYAGGVLELA